MRQTLNQKVSTKPVLIKHMLTGTVAEVIGYRDGKVIVEVTKAPTAHRDWLGEQWALSGDEINTFWFDLHN